MLYFLKSIGFYLNKLGLILNYMKKTYFENFKNCFLNGQGNYEIIMIYSRVIEY